MVTTQNGSNQTCFLFGGYKSRIFHVVSSKTLQTRLKLVKNKIEMEVTPSEVEQFVNAKERQIFDLATKNGSVERRKYTRGVVVGKCKDAKQANYFKGILKNLYLKSAEDIEEILKNAFDAHTTSTAAHVMQFNIINFYAMHSNFASADRIPHEIMQKLAPDEGPYGNMQPMEIFVDAAEAAQENDDHDDELESVKQIDAQFASQAVGNSKISVDLTPVMPNVNAASLQLDPEGTSAEPTRFHVSRTVSKADFPVLDSGESVGFGTNSSTRGRSLPIDDANVDSERSNETSNFANVSRSPEPTLLVKSVSAYFPATERREGNGDRRNSAPSASVAQPQQGENPTDAQSLSMSKGSVEVAESRSKDDAGGWDENETERLVIEETSEVAVDAARDAEPCSSDRALDNQFDDGELEGYNEFVRNNSIEVKSQGLPAASPAILMPPPSSTVAPSMMVNNDDNDHAENSHILFDIDESVHADEEGECYLVYVWFSPTQMRDMVEVRVLQTDCVCGSPSMPLTIHAMSKLIQSPNPIFRIEIGKHARTAALLDYCFVELEAFNVCSRMDTYLADLVDYGSQEQRAQLWTSLVDKARAAGVGSCKKLTQAASGPAGQSFMRYSSVANEFASECSGSRKRAYYAHTYMSDDDDDETCEKSRKKNKNYDLDDDAELKAIGQFRAPSYYSRLNISEAFQGNNLFYHFGVADKRYFILMKMSIYDFSMFALLDNLLKNLLFCCGEPASKSFVRAEVKSVAPKVAYRLRYKQDVHLCEPAVDIDCHCILVAVCRDLERAAVEKRMSELFSQLNGNLTQCAPRVHAARVTLYQQYSIEDSTQPSVLSVLKGKRAIALKSRGRQATPGTRTYQPRQITYANSKIEELHANGSAYEADSPGRVAVGNKAPVYVNAVALLEAIKFYRLKLTTKSYRTEIDQEAEIKKIGNKIVYDSIRLIIPQSLQVYMTVKKENRTDQNSSLFVLGEERKNAILKLSRVIKQSLNNYLSLRNTRLPKEKQFPLVALPKMLSRCIGRHFIDLRSKTLRRGKPLFDYTVALNEMAQAKSIISKYPKLNLATYETEPFTMQSLCSVADFDDVGLEGLESSQNKRSGNTMNGAGRQTQTDRCRTDNDDAFMQ